MKIYLVDEDWHGLIGGFDSLDKAFDFIEKDWGVKEYFDIEDKPIPRSEVDLSEINTNNGTYSISAVELNSSWC